MRGQRARAVALVATAICLPAGVATSGGAAQASVTVAPPTLPSGTVGSPYSNTITVGGPSPPYTVRVTQGVLPSGLSLSPAGSLGGTPTRSGSFAFTISAFTSAGTYVGFRDYVVAISWRPGGGSKAYFADDFETGLGKWKLWGGANAYSVVTGERGQGAAITVGPSTTGATSSASELASLWLDWPFAYAGAGQSTWYAAKVRFPGGYQPTAGQWNWFMEWHNDIATSGYRGAYSPGLGVFTDYPVTSRPGRNPRLAFRIMSGPVTAPRKYVFALGKNSLKRNWWYDILVHFVWSADASVGLAELWVDGKLVISTRIPTLFSHPSGSTSYNSFGLYNYRPKASWDASIHFDRIRIGPTKASVVGKRRPNPPARHL
jgi:hypothetical protein